MGDGPILSIIQPITFDTMLNNNWQNDGHGLKNVTCKQGITLSLNVNKSLRFAVLFTLEVVNHDITNIHSSFLLKSLKSAVMLYNLLNSVLVCRLFVNNY